MFVSVVEHTCHNAVSCFLKCICGIDGRAVRMWHCFPLHFSMG